ncbi:response regulator [bacterium]|nr:response regulator [bacterium]
MSEKTTSILVVEDDEQSQKYMRILLSREYDVHIAATGQRAWEILEEHSINLILMDLSLRDGEDGLQITRKIRQDMRFKDISIIALTAHAFPEDRKRSLEAGCNDYVSKPFQWVHLKSVMEKFL